MADRVGQQFGNYRLVRLLGQGGYAEVYLGQHVRLELQAAIKVLHTQLTAEESAQFQQEAQTIARLTHPSIVRVFDYDVQDGIPFLVVDYAPGGSLRQRYPRGSVLSLPQIVSYVKQIATALQYAHERKFIHRDVKPENMLLGRQEEVLLSDFGLAALAHSSGSLSTQEAVGTLAYMAPEQIEGYPRAASDQYALAVVVYEWLCGSRPFEGSLTEVMVQHLSAPPPPLRERVSTISPEVEQVVLRALAKDPKARFASVRDFAQALEQASQLASSPNVPLASESPSPGSAVAVALAPDQVGALTEATPSADFPAGAFDPTVFPGSAPSSEGDTPQSQDITEVPLAGQVVTPAVAASLLEPTTPLRYRSRRLSGRRSMFLIGMAVLVVAAGVLSSTSLLAHFRTLSTGGNGPAGVPAHGGTWTIDIIDQPTSLLPDGSSQAVAAEADQALYLPLFYSDAQGGIHPGAASEVPTVQNGGISADATIWTFHLRPHLVWSDGQPYDARDVDFTWRLWLNPAFNASFAYGETGLQLISSAAVSADHLSITFHLKQPYVPFLQNWVDGGQAPLPAHHFRVMAPGKILTSPDDLNPQVTSGPFLMSESVPGNHYTLARNALYYRASQGLPYLDKLVFRIVSMDTILSNLQAGKIDSTAWLDATQAQAYQGLHNYTLVTPSTDAAFEVLYFNFHNTVLASHLEVRQAIAIAIDYESLVASIPDGFATSLCTDHGTFYHPGFDPGAPCPIFDPAAANKLLDDNGWVRGPDGVRSKQGQRLEFDYVTEAQRHTSSLANYRNAGEAILERDLRAIGIQLDIQNYDVPALIALMFKGQASPPTGAVPGRYDIGELENTLGYDPDDSSLLSCDQFPPNGLNLDFYCNHTLDALYQEELATPDVGARQQIFAQIHQIYLADFPFIVLYSPPVIFIVRKGTHNYQPSPLGFQDENVWEWWCDKGKC